MSRPRILLVDGDRRVRHLVRLTLPADACELSFAEEGTDAIRMAQQSHPDLILLDDAVPGIRVVDFCAAIRSDPMLSGTPILMLTGHDDEARQRAILAGTNGVLTRPFSPLALEQTIRSLLGAGALPPLAPDEIGPSRARRPDEAPPGLDSTVGTIQASPSNPPATGPDDAGLPLDLVRELDGARHRYADLHDTFVTTVEALATALELRTAAVEGHAQRVSLYAVAAARRLGVAADELEQLRWGAILHDVGMIAVPDAILSQSGPLRPDEWALVRAHPERGARLLEHIPELGAAVAIIRCHHERFDGAGYPLGLRGAAIPLGARIVAVADALDAITTERPYRPTRTWEQARDEILRGRGTHFDPSVVDAFLEIVDDLPELASAEQSSHAHP
jgi:ribonuclease P protein subunit RPR2